jgi:hypothetical protein
MGRILDRDGRCVGVVPLREPQGTHLPTDSLLAVPDDKRLWR